MKVIFFAFLALAVGANALPQEYELQNDNREPRIIEGQIRRAFDAISEVMRSNGLDPVQVIDYELRTTVQPGVLLWLKVKELHILGASNFDLPRVSYNAITSRLIIHFRLPRVSAEIGNSALEVNYHGTRYTATLSGSFVITDLRVEVDARISVGIISGISIRSLDMGFFYPRTDSRLSVTLQGEDHSNTVNNAMNVTVPQWMAANKRAIDRFLSEFFKDLLNELLN